MSKANKTRSEISNSENFLLFRSKKNNNIKDGEIIIIAVMRVLRKITSSQIICQFKVSVKTLSLFRRIQICLFFQSDSVGHHLTHLCSIFHIQLEKYYAN